MFSTRPGWRFSHSLSSALICLRWRFSCEPQSVHGMIGNCFELGVRVEVGLLAVRERPDHDVLAVVGDELGRHRFQLAAEEHVEEERLEDVVAMVAERDLGRAELARDAVEHAAPQPRAERAHRLAFGDDALHHRIGVLLGDAVRHAAATRDSRGSTCSGKARLLLVEVDRDDVERRPARALSGAAARRAARSCPCRPTGRPSPCRRRGSCRSRRSPGRRDGAGAWRACWLRRPLSALLPLHSSRWLFRQGIPALATPSAGYCLF